MPSNPASLIRKILPTARRLLVEKDIKRTSVQPGSSILVVGAGHDPYVLKGMNESFVVRLDIEYFEGSTDVVADAHSLPFNSATFDYVVAIEVLEHLYSPPVFLSEAHRVLSDTGRLIITVPYMYHEHGDPYDFYRFSPGGIKMLLSDFRSVSMGRQGNRLHVISDLVTTGKIFGFKPALPLRFANNIFRVLNFSGSKSSAPTGFFVVADK